MGMTPSASGEFCNLNGTRELLRRIESARAAQGLPCNLIVARVAVDRGGHVVYGIRERNDERVVTVAAKRNLTTSWHKDAKRICEHVLKRHPGVTLQDVLGPARQRKITAARHDCIRACADENMDTIAALARFFNVNDMTVWRSVNGRKSRATVQ